MKARMANFTPPRTPTYATLQHDLAVAKHIYSVECRTCARVGLDVKLDPDCIVALRAYDAARQALDTMNGYVAAFEAFATGDAEYNEVCLRAGSTRMAEEQAALSCGREFLPPVALVVLAKARELTGPEITKYYAWLIDGVQTALRHHDVQLGEP